MTPRLSSSAALLLLLNLAETQAGYGIGSCTVGSGTAGSFTHTAATSVRCSVRMSVRIFDDGDEPHAAAAARQASAAAAARQAWAVKKAEREAKAAEDAFRREREAKAADSSHHAEKATEDRRTAAASAAAAARQSWAAKRLAREADASPATAARLAWTSGQGAQRSARAIGRASLVHVHSIASLEAVAAATGNLTVVKFMRPKCRACKTVEDQFEKLAGLNLEQRCARPDRATHNLACSAMSSRCEIHRGVTLRRERRDLRTHECHALAHAHHPRPISTCACTSCNRWVEFEIQRTEEGVEAVRQFGLQKLPSIQVCACVICVICVRLSTQHATRGDAHV